MSIPNSRDAVATTTGFQFLFDLETSFARQAAVMGANLAFTEALRELVRDPFD
jgi:hypothetical protein